VPSPVRDEAAVLLEPCGKYGHFPMHLFCSSRSGGRTRGFWTTRSFPLLLPQTPWILRLFCRKATGAGIAGAISLCFVLVGLLKLASFLCLCPLVPPSPSPPETTTIPISKWVVPWRNDGSLYSLLSPTVSSLISLKWSFHCLPLNVLCTYL